MKKVVLITGSTDGIGLETARALLTLGHMVREAFGHVRADVSVGADILVRAALSPEFSDAAGQYFDNDAGRFAPPHPDALDSARCKAVVDQIERLLAA